MSDNEGIPNVSSERHASGPKNISQYLTDHMVDIFVGAERKKFHLHRDLLCERSKFFQGAFGNHFIEAETKELALPEDSTECFELLVGWLYGAPLMSISSMDQLLVYINLAILAEKLCLETLQDETMDQILKFYRSSSPKLLADTIRHVYKHTSVGDPLRQLIYRFASWKVAFDEAELDHNDEDLLAGGGEVAIDFTSMLVHYYYYAKEVGDLLVIDPRKELNCFYHKHNSTSACRSSPDPDA